ncbi:hypothetical protein BJ875DRAFT_377255 [Amylocarpus encephaloides]|uniref:Zn(2)-C6 fungal-type domain-containing protein n=1 Tax=Amylocarpus encephaloides TaxID=45428 RepID=A0A9P8C5C7_9HELO|nr:hypothetical protein BJ875DRAFT_377255 [Amylocarpus encephaloides]
MQSSTSPGETPYIPLGERRGKSGLAPFFLDLSWARAVSDRAPPRAYPSPPMSGSPRQPFKFNPDSRDRGHGGYLPSGQNVLQGPQAPQSQQTDPGRPPIAAYPSGILAPSAYLASPLEQAGPRPPPPRAFPPEGLPTAAYPTRYRLGENPFSLPNQTPPQQRALPIAPTMFQQYPSFQQHYALPPTSLAPPERPPKGEGSYFSSPKAQRKPPKPHVSSACVPCKRAHLRQRPCSRCITNGKEDTCVDVQHKKRGRPRLRDDREQRHEAMGHPRMGYPNPVEGSMRHPLATFDPSTASMNPEFADSLHRSESYRVLESQGGPPPPRYMEHASMSGANAGTGFMMPAPRMLPLQEPLCAYLTMKMQVAKVTQSFGGVVGNLGGVRSRNLQELVGTGDYEKVERLQRIFEVERRQQEPHFLPPIVTNLEEERVIQSVGFGPEEAGHLRPEHQEAFTVQGRDGQPRIFQARLRLAKKDSTYFVVMVLNVPAPATPQAFQQPSPSPYPREPYSRGSQHEYQTAQSYPPSQGPSPFKANPGYADPRGEQMGYRGLAPDIQPSFSQPPTRWELAPSQHPYQTPRNELPPGQPQRQHELQLPPIRDQLGDTSSVDPRQRDDRTNRFDIGGLLQNPRASRE